MPRRDPATIRSQPLFAFRFGAMKGAQPHRGLLLAMTGFLTRVRSVDTNAVEDNDCALAKTAFRSEGGLTLARGRNAALLKSVPAEYHGNRSPPREQGGA